MRIFEDLLDDITPNDLNRKRSLDVIDDADAQDIDQFMYVMSVCVGYYYRNERRENDDYRRIINLQKFHDDVVTIVDTMSFFDEYTIDPRVLVYDENGVPKAYEVIDSDPLPTEFDVREFYNRARRQLGTHVPSDHPVIEVRVYFNPFKTYGAVAFRRNFWKMLQRFNVLKTYHKDSGYCMFSKNMPDNKDSMRDYPLVKDTSFTSCAEQYSWNYVFTPRDIDRLYDKIVEHPDENYERQDSRRFNFQQKRILDKMNLEALAKRAADEAPNYGMTLTVGRCKKPDYQAVYERDLNNALSYIAFTLTPDNWTVEIFDIEEMLYHCLIKHMPYLYVSICEFGVLLRVNGKVTNDKYEQLRQDYIRNHGMRPPYRIDREKLKFYHDPYAEMGFTTVDTKTLNNTWTDRVRSGSFSHNTVTDIIIAIGDKNGAVSRAVHYFRYPAERFDEIIQTEMRQEEIWLPNKD